jgi:hypothetical protein
LEDSTNMRANRRRLVWVWPVLILFAIACSDEAQSRFRGDHEELRKLVVRAVAECLFV